MRHPPRPALTALAALAIPSAALAQGLADLGPNLPPLPPTPLHEQYLLENPWPAVGVLLILGAGVAYSLNRAGRARHAALALLVAIALAAGAALTGTLVETKRETVADACRALVAATGRADADALAPMLHPDVRTATRYGSPYGRDRVLALVGAQIPGAGLRGAAATRVNAALSGVDMATTQIRVRIDNNDYPPSWWRVDWLRDPRAPEDHPTGGWQATHIEPLWILGVRDPNG